MFLEEDDDASVAAELTKQSLVDTQARMGMMLDLMPMGLLIHTRQGIIFANQEAARLLQYSQDNLIGRHFLDFLQSDVAQAEDQIEGAFAGAINANSTQVEIRSSEGSVRTIKLMAGALPWDGNAVVQLLLQDITDLKLIQDSLHRLTITDELSGAYNRRHAFSTAASILAQEPPVSFGVAILDIDHFKRVNDTYGHASGDMAIKSLSAIASQSLSSSDKATFARIGGEEFIILLPGMGNESVLAACERVRAAVEQEPISSPLGPFQITVSIGISFNGDVDRDFDSLFANADRALYEAKQSGRNRICVDVHTAHDRRRVA